MATGTVTVINTTSVDLSSDLTNSKFTSSALTLSADFVDLEIAYTGVDGIVDVSIEGSVGGTNYSPLLSPEGNYEIPVKKVITEASGVTRLAINGLDAVYARVVVYSNTATAGTLTITANH